MNDSARANRKIMFITVFAAIFLVLMLAALVTNLVRLASLNARKAELEAQIAEMDRQIAENQAEIDYRKTDEYVDSYAREYLGMIGEDEKGFIAK